MLLTGDVSVPCCCRPSGRMCWRSAMVVMCPGMQALLLFRLLQYVVARDHCIFIVSRDFQENDSGLIDLCTD